MTMRVVKRLSMPCLPGSRSTPVLPPESSSATRRRAPGAVGSSSASMNAVEVVAVGREDLATGARVRAEDLHPQLGVARRDARDIAEALPGEARAPRAARR